MGAELLKSPHLTTLYAEREKPQVRVLINLLKYIFMESVMSVVNTAMQDGNTQDTTSKMGYTASSRPRLQLGTNPNRTSDLQEQHSYPGTNPDRATHMITEQ